MGKHNVKEIIALVLAAVMIIAVSFSFAVYAEQRDMEQVVISIESFGMEYEVPFYVDYKNMKNEVVKDKSGNVIKTVQRDQDGNPIHKPKLDGGNIVYFEDERSEKVIESKSGDEYFISYYEYEKNNADYAEVFKYEGLTSDKKAAQWRNIDTKEIIHSDVMDCTVANAPVSYGASAKGIPTVCYTAADWWYFLKEPVAETAVWDTPTKEYTKHELMYYYDRSGQQLLSQGNTLEQVYKILARGMYTIHFMGLEAEKRVMSGELEWELTEQNNVKKQFYGAIDEAISGIFNEIFATHGEPSVDASTPDKGEPTYPVQGSTAGVGKDYEEWTPDVSYLGYGSSPQRSSLVREAIRRWVSNVKNIIKNNYMISAAQRTVFDAEIAELEEMARDNTKITDIYPNLLAKNGDGEYKYSVVWHIYGDSIDKNLKSSALSAHVGKDKTVSDSEVRAVYDNLLADQKDVFRNLEAYYSVVSGGNVTLLNFASDEYFYVKHILLPFPADVSAELTKLKDSGNYRDGAYEAIRQGAAIKDNADAYPVYKHKDGENDLSKAYTVSEAYAHINSIVGAASTPEEKEKAFEEMIFLYNTDPGIFNSETGYSVTKTPKLDGGRDETYVIEFATAARDLRSKGAIGAISEPVLGDYGYHILYLLKVPAAGETRGLYEKLTVGGTTTVYDKLSASTLAQKQQNAYNSWTNERTSYYERETDYVKIFTDRYQDLIDKQSA